MGFWSNVIGTTDRSHNDDGSYTDRDSNGNSTTRNSDGSLRSYSREENPLFGLKGTTTYDSNGKVVNWNRKD